MKLEFIACNHSIRQHKDYDLKYTILYVCHALGRT
jgi:hypothetical protein